jgi:hypothetical protein
MDLDRDSRLRQIGKTATTYSGKLASELARYCLRMPKGTWHFEKGENDCALLEKAMAVKDRRLQMAAFDLAHPSDSTVLAVAQHGSAAKEFLPHLLYVYQRCGSSIVLCKQAVFSAIAQVDPATAGELLSSQEPKEVRKALLEACIYAPRNRRRQLLEAFAESKTSIVREEALGFLRANQGSLDRMYEFSGKFDSHRGNILRAAHAFGCLKLVRIGLIDPLLKLGSKLTIMALEAKGVRDIPDSIKAL